jgi:spore coat polysaccharide biosynthesis protein SpsF
MSHRWTIDYEADYQFIKTVFEHLYPISPFFTMYDILNLLREKPELSEINKHYAGVNWYRHHINELNTIKPHQTKIMGSGPNG